MMEIITISQVSKQFNISTRMLRYYEKKGLISSIRLPDYSYRVYDENAVMRIQQILILRKLRIPVQQIATILDDTEQKKALKILRDNLSELDSEISALNTVRSILAQLADRLDENIRDRVRLDILNDTDLIDVLHVLKPPKTNLKEEMHMEQLMDANKVLEEKMDIRIIYIPPSKVAAYRCVGESPEEPAKELISAFIKESNLQTVKPDFRLYGFNSPSPEEGQREYGYEFWVTIPDDMEVKSPIEKKELSGGLYAAHCIQFGDFHEWGPFRELILNNKEYEIDWRDNEGDGGFMEEELNIFTNIIEKEPKAVQLDLLIPIKKRTSDIIDG